MKHTIAILAALFASGCTSFKGDVTKTKPDGTQEHSKMTITSFWDAKNELNKVSAGQTEKSQKIGVSGLNQETSATNVVRALELINSILAKGAMGL